MICSLDSIRSKEVIDIRSGEKLGYIDDVQMNIGTSDIIALVIYGRQRLFGILGKEEDIVIPCSEIEVIGKEVLLIRHSETNFSSESIKNKENKWKSLFK